MAGSDFYNRTKKEQADDPSETADSQTSVQVAIVYQGNQVTVYRNGQEYARHQIAEPQKFGIDSVAVIGLRHLEAGDRAGFVATSRDCRNSTVSLSIGSIGPASSTMDTTTGGP